MGIRNPLSWSRSDRHRLGAAIDVFRAEMRIRQVERDGEWAVEAAQLLDDAREQSDAKSDEAWTYYQAAVRHGIAGLSPQEVWAEQRTVLADATAEGKLNQWRRDVVTGLLDPAKGVWWDRTDAETMLEALAAGKKEALSAALFDDRGQGNTAVQVQHVLEAAGRSPKDAASLAGALVCTFRRRMSDNRVWLFQAMMVRDDAARNAYRRTRLLRENVMWLAGAVALIAVLLVILAFALPIDLDSDAGEGAGRIWLYGLLLGGLGGAVSAMQRTTTRGTRGRLPELREQGVIVLVLPLVGAAAGIAAIPLATAGIIPVKSSVAAVLAVSFAAGFSERLIVQAVAAVSGGEKKAS